MLGREIFKYLILLKFNCSHFLLVLLVVLFVNLSLPAAKSKQIEFSNQYLGHIKLTYVLNRLSLTFCEYMLWFLVKIRGGVLPFLLIITKFTHQNDKLIFQLVYTTKIKKKKFFFHYF